MRHKDLELQKRDMVENYRSSGMAAAKWCDENQVKLSNLRYWITRCNKQESLDHTDSGFIEFTSKAEISAPIAVCIGRFRIELSAGFDVQAFQEAVHILKSL